MALIPFEKYQGLGNDFVLFDWRAQPHIGIPNPDVIKRLCDRRFGVGADGILVFRKEDRPTTVRMVYFNADGSRAETCFNGLRCIARHAVRTGILMTEQPFIIQSDAAPVNALVRGDGLVQTEMPGPTFDPAQVPIVWDKEAIQQEFEFGSVQLTGTALAIGNPHFVVWEQDKDLSDLNEMVARIGAAVEQSPLFPHGTNLEIANYISPDRVEMAVWERGVGVTPACGSGATATVCAGVKIGLLPSDTLITVQMAGGEIRIQVDAGFRKVTVIGDATHVYSGSLDPAAWSLN
jgi:diaminopimelate epimerase